VAHDHHWDHDRRERDFHGRDHDHDRQ
jgi:hypothetical protein